MKKIIKNIPIILKKFKFLKYFCIFSILLFMLINFSSISLLTDSSKNIESNVSDEIKDLFEKNDEKKKLIYKFLDEFKKEKEVENLTSGEIGWGSSIQSLGENKYLVGTHDKGFWFLKFDNDGLVVQANKIQGDVDVDVTLLTTDGDVGNSSSIQSLGENKYLVGTGTSGFWLLKFNDDGLVVQTNKIQDKNEVDVSASMGGDKLGWGGSSIQKLGDTNKYLVGTFNKGFWLLEFDNNGLVVQANKIQGKNNLDVSILITDDGVGQSSSIQKLGENKYLVGTGTSGFWFLKFDDNGLVVRANKIKGDDGGDVPDLTGFNNKIGLTSSIQVLGNNKYLVGTYNRGFWLLEFNDNTNKFSIAKKIEGVRGVVVSNLTTDTNVGHGSLIQNLGKNKYLIGTLDKGFWFLKFDEAGLVVQTNKIEGDVDVVDVWALMGGDISSHFSSLHSLGNNKYLVGTKTKGFWFLKFDNNGLVVQANKIKKLEKVTNNEFDGFYNEKIEKFKNEYKKLQTFSNFESNDKIFWKEFVMEMFDIDEENKKAKIVDNYSFNKNEIWTEEKLKKFKKFLFKKNVESEVDSGKNNDSKKKDETKIGSGKWKLWFLIMIPIVPIVIYLFILFRKKNKKRINK